MPRHGAIAAVTAVAVACRAQLTFGSSIWADEGMALNVVSIPTVSGMIKFLQLHESHPPLFYLMLRAWRGIAGTGDLAAFSLMLFIATLLVPATYAVARCFMGRNASILAASLVAVSPAIAEHSSQLRPYGLLHLLVLVSCYLLAEAIERRGLRRWSGFILVTALMLYTHNWAWLVFGSQAIAAAIALMRMPAVDRRPRSFELGIAVVAVMLLYLPWFSTLLYQRANAGHTPLELETMGDVVAFWLFALVSIPDYLLLGLYPRSPLRLVLVSGLVAGMVVVAMAFAPRVGYRLFRSNEHQDGLAGRKSDPLQMFVIISSLSIAGAAVLSPWTTLFIQRCVAMLTPLVLIWLADLVSRMLTKTDNVRRAPLALGLLAFLVTLEVTSIIALVSTTRSNSRAVASTVGSLVRGDDLLVTAPEWFAPSFNHYFPPSIEQRDHPQAGRSGTVDFTSPQRRSLDPVATAALTRVVSDARASGRRVWLVTERTYLRYADQVLPTINNEEQLARYAPVRRTKEARDLLIKAYGPPDTTHFVRGRLSRYEELLPMLFEPPSASRSAF